MAQFGVFPARAMIALVVLAVCLVAGASRPVEARGFGLFIRGDVDGDGAVLISDPIQLLTVLFGPGVGALDCEDAADANDDGLVDIGDPVAILSALFVAGSPPLPEPYPSCGSDWTDDGLSCWSPPPGCVPPQMHYILDAPPGDLDDAIVQVEIPWGGSPEVSVLLPPAAEREGMHLLESGESGAILWAARRDPATGEESLLEIDTGSGTVVSTTTGFAGEIRALSEGGGVIHLLLVDDAAATTELVRIDSWGTGPPETVWSTPEPLDVGGLTQSESEIYFTAWGPGGSAALHRVEWDGTHAIIASDLAAAGPIQYSLFGLIWVVGPSGGTSVQFYGYEPTGTLSEELTIDGIGPSEFGDLGITADEALLLPLVDLGQVVQVELWPWSGEVIADGLAWPVSAAGQDSFAIP